MADAQIFQLFGIVFVPAGLVWVINPKAFREMVKDIINNSGVLFISGLSAVAIGYLLIAFHNTWALDRSVIITILGWVSLLKGLLIIITPSAQFLAFYNSAIIKKYVSISPWLVLIVGVVSLCLGFFA
jgi:uncharacterized protein YjeT (DUF2065 family)